jgi:hypothetical protein
MTAGLPSTADAPLQHSESAMSAIFQTYAPQQSASSLASLGRLDDQHQRHLEAEAAGSLRLITTLGRRAAPSLGCSAHAPNPSAGG